MKQAKLKLKLTIGPVKSTDVALTMDPVDPPLSKEKITSRMVLVPPEQWPGVSEHGWIAKVMKLDLRTSVCSVKFHDGTYRFNLATARSGGACVFPTPWLGL